MVDPMLDLIPEADVHHIGMYRSKGSLLPVQYYNKLPRDKSADVGEMCIKRFLKESLIRTLKRQYI